MTEYSLEKFWVKDPELKQIIDETPQAKNEQDFVNQIRPGDFISPYRADSKITDGVFDYTIQQANHFFQGIAFTSLKIFTERKTVIGYGVIPSRGEYIDEIAIEQFMRPVRGGILMRHIMLSNNSVALMLAYIRNQMKIAPKYDYWLQAKEVIMKKFFKKRNINNPSEGNGLFCSALAAEAIVHAGLPLGMEDIGVTEPLSVIPSDFIRSKTYQNKCTFFRKGEI